MVLGGVGVLLGFPLADPLMGVLITIMITVLLIGTVREVGKRLLDGVDPALMQRGEHALARALPTTQAELALRWSGHRLHATVQLDVNQDTPVGQFREQAQTADYALRAALPRMGPVTISPRRSMHTQGS